MRWIALIITLMLLTNTSCVSVSLGQREIKRASGIRLTEPSAPLAKISRSDVDAAWKNSANGNLLSYISDCQDETDPPLDMIVQGALGGLSELQMESKESPLVQGREARRVKASGKVDGVPTKIDLVTFKRDNCIYILSYVGVEKSFGVDHAQFDQFLKGFQAP